MKNIKKYLIISTSVFLLSGFVTNYFEISKNLEIFNNIYREINSYYVDPVDPGELMHSTIDTMLKRLDPYTKYIPESEIEDFRFQTTGEYGGIGSTIRKIDKNVVIYEPYKNCPADKSGLKMGDVLIEIGGQEINDASVQDVSDLLKGTPGTTVNVKILRKEDLIKDISIVREKIQVPSVPYAGIIDSVGYIKLKRFTKNCSKEVEEAISKLFNEHNLNGLILDLRSNPGGLLNESIRIANLFIDKNETVVTTNGKNIEWEKNYTTKIEPKYPKIPIVVLVNGSSASASEIVAGAIQDLDRGIIIGNKTFGKGLVQQSRNLSYNARLKVTVAKYYTPSGRCIQDVIKTQNYNSYLNNDQDNQSDSLRNKFLTRNGREVFDGGGIDPDIKIEKPDFPEILWPLIRDNYIFNFSNELEYNVDPNYPLSTFTLPDSIYEQFVSYLEEVEFTFTANSEFIIDNIESEINELSGDDLNLEKISEELKILKGNINNNKKQDVQKYKTEINKHLTEHLINRYFYEAGRIEYQLNDDPYINKALMMLNDTNQYNRILSP